MPPASTRRCVCCAARGVFAVTLGVRAWVSTRFLAFFVSWAIFQSYWGMWLAHRGLSVSEIGAAVGCSLAARAVTVAVVYPALNRHATLLRLSRIVPWLVTAASVPYLFVIGFPMLLVISIAFGFIYPIMLPLNETIATVAARRGLLPYGPTRALGSLGFIVGTLAAGGLTSLLGAGVLAPTLIGACLLIAVIGIIGPRDADALSIRGSGMHGFAALARDRAFLACLTIAVLVQGSHAAYYSFGALRASEITSPAAVPLLLVLAPLSEFALFFLARRRFERCDYRTLFAIGIVVAAARWVLLAFAGNWQLLAFSQLLHGGSFATTHMAFTMYVRDRVTVDIHATAQGLYASLATGLGTAVLTVVAGLLISASFEAALITMALAALSGIIFLPALGPLSSFREMSRDAARRSRSPAAASHLVRLPPSREVPPPGPGREGDGR
ncbi:MFS transporter [Rathayibacter iranicus]|uniref:MFS transporter n=1 Tax=Rathayibacter iranicus TaxID=59737 RepID=UPI003084471C